MSFSISTGVALATICGISAMAVSGLFLLGDAGRMSAWLAVPIGASTFAGSFALVNLAMQPSHLTAVWLHSELVSGRLALRATSVSFAAAFAVLLFRVRSTEMPAFAYGELYGEVSAYAAEARRDREWTPERITREYAVFGLSIAGLWAYTLAGHGGTPIALLNWATAFVWKDYSVAAGYRVREARVPPPREALRLTISLIALAGILLWTFWAEFTTEIALMGSLTVVMLLAGIPFLRRTGRALMELITTIGIMPQEGMRWTPDGAAYLLHETLVTELSQHAQRPEGDDPTEHSDLSLLAWEVIRTVIACTAAANQASTPPPPLSFNPDAEYAPPHDVAKALASRLAPKELAPEVAEAGVRTVLSERGWGCENVRRLVGAVNEGLVAGVDYERPHGQ